MTDTAALLRFSRDKRGYESFYLVRPVPNRHGGGHSRILYWFRTPPGVKVGRSPFDEEMRRAIEARNPGVTFDWPRLLAARIPPPAADVERWRERRLTERAARAARSALQTERAVELGLGSAELDSTEADAASRGAAVTLEANGSGLDAGTPDEHRPGDQIVTATPQDAPPTSDVLPEAAHRRRRRRRRGRRQQVPTPNPES